MLKKYLSLATFMCSGLLFSQNYPGGFSQAKVGTVYYPTAMASAPDGRIFICEKAGRVKILKNGAILSTAFLQVNVDQQNERGLGGIAIDPDFSSNNYVYIYYTVPGSTPKNRLSRVTANGDVAAANSEVVLLEFEPAQNSIHNGGGMDFGPDGKLYLAIGDDKVSSNAQNLHTHKGKVLRLNKDGTTPSGNPFSGSAAAARVWAYGFRNPFTIDIQPGTGKLFVNDVGEGAWEEINNATTAGKNFGWPSAEGNSSNPAYTNPVYAYGHTSSGTSGGCGISSGNFFNPPATNYPSQYIGKYFFVDYCNDWINYIDPSGGPATNFASNLPGALVSIHCAKDGNLYFLSIASSGIYKIVYSGGAAPAITQQPSSQTVSQGQQAVFSVVAGGATPLSYQWYKNNVAISGATGASYVISNAQSSHQGSYKATVTNAYGSVTSNSASLTVTAFNAQPAASITTPSAGTMYSGGQVIAFAGTASDPEDGTLPASSYTWEIRFYHDQHNHPGPAIPAGVTSGTFTVPVTGESSANVYYRIILYVKDSQNRADTAYRDIYPRTSRITLKSNPGGLQLEVEGQPVTATHTFMAVENMRFNIGAVSPQALGGTNYTFSSWSQGGAASQTVVIPVNDATYTATYGAAGSSTAGCTASGSILREYWSNVQSTSLSDIPFGSPPSGSSQLNLFEGPSDFGDNYGSRIRGYICPPATGNYTFWIASDNTSELWIGTGASPSTKIKRASVTGWTMPREWNKYASQQSAAIYLVAGQKYYVEAIHRESGEGDHLSVGWQLPNGTQERPVPGNRLSPFEPGFSVYITSPASNSSFAAGSPIPVSAAVSGGGNIQKVEFYAGNVKIGEDLTSPYSYTWTSATAGAHQLTARAINAGTTVISSPVTVNVTTPGGCTASGSITREVWTNIPGASISSIPLSSPPQVSGQLSIFKAPSNSGDNYGQRIRGFVCPPATGNYYFWIASDDNSELWLSSNADPDNKMKIAYVSGWTASQEWTKYPSQKSAAIYLVEGQKYYIEALHKEGSQGDNLAVGWQLPGGALERPIPGSRLSPAGAALSAAITSPANNTQFSTGSNVSVTATFSGGSGSLQKMEFFSAGAKLGEDLSAPYTYVISNAADGSYTLTARAIDGAGASAVSPPVNIQVGTTASCVSSGFITREVWYNAAGTAVSSIPVSNPPGTVEQISIFQSPADVADNYGQRIRGYICPPVTGEYTFWIASDDNSELWLSTGNLVSGRVKIASSSGWTLPGEWTKYATQQSTPVQLTAGQKYYIEALHKEGSQGDHVAVGWRLPNGVMERPIPGSRLSPYNESAPPSVCSASIRPGGATTFCQGGKVVLYANTGQGFSYQWKVNGAEISGSTMSTYTATTGGDYQVRISYPGCVAYSAPVEVTVNDYLTARITPGGPTTFCSGGQVTLYGNPCEGYIYQWKKDGEDISGANSVNYIATQSGSYQLKIIHGSSINWSALVDVTVNDCGGASKIVLQQEGPPEDSVEVAEAMEKPLSTIAAQPPAARADSAGLRVYPNPGTGLFTFNFCMEDMPVGTMEIIVLSATGDEVYRRPPVRINGCVKEEIELSNALQTGIYILQIRIGERVESTKMILIR